MIATSIKKSILIALCALSSSLFAADPDLSGWTHVHDKHDVRVYRKEIPDSPVIAVRGIATIPYPLSEVYAAMADNVRSPEWVPMVSKKQTIRQIDADSRVEYARIEMPWPLRDRYTVARARLEILPGDVYSISYKSVDGEMEDEGRIRARLDSSTFYLRPEGQDRTYMDITLLSDPKGAVPKFLVNTFQKDWPVKFLDGLKLQVAKLREEKTSPASINEMPVAH